MTLSVQLLPLSLIICGAVRTGMCICRDHFLYRSAMQMVIDEDRPFLTFLCTALKSLI